MKEEAQAKAEGLGIWQGESHARLGVPRQQRWAAAEQQAPEGCAIKGNVTKHGRIYHMPWSPWYAQIRIEAGQGQALVLHGGRGDRRGLAAGGSALGAAKAGQRRSSIHARNLS